MDGRMDGRIDGRTNKLMYERNEIKIGRYSLLVLNLTYLPPSKFPEKKHSEYHIFDCNFFKSIFYF